MLSAKAKEKLISKYTDILLYILTFEDPKYKGINHYLLLQHIVERHYQQSGRLVIEGELSAKISSAAEEVAAAFLDNGDGFTGMCSSELFELIEPVLAGKLV